MPSNEDYDQWMEGEGNRVTIIVCPFFQEGVASSCAYIQRLDKVVYTQGWILGKDEYSALPPAALLDGSVLHALSLVEAHLPELEQEQGYLDVQVGDRRTVQALRAWFKGGTLGLRSAEASEIVRKLRKIYQNYLAH